MMTQIVAIIHWELLKTNPVPIYIVWLSPFHTYPCFSVLPFCWNGEYDYQWLLLIMITGIYYLCYQGQDASEYQLLMNKNIRTLLDS